MESVLTGVTPPERQAVMQLADGRRFAWSEWGPTDGIPVLFCTGAGMSGWLGFGSDCLADLGLRLIAFDRPGLGRSDPHPTKTLDSWVADVREWMAAQQCLRGLAVGFSQGAPFAFALAAAGLVQAIAIVSGQDELSHAAVRSGLNPEVAGMVAVVQQDPVGFAQQFDQMATAEGLWQLILGMSADCDRALYESEGFGAAFRQALQEGFSQGAEGYVQDLVNALSPWPMRLEEIAVPIDLWYGRLDTSPVHSPDFGATLAARLANGVHRVDPEAGGAILWTRSEEILASLKAWTPTYRRQHKLLHGRDRHKPDS